MIRLSSSRLASTLALILMGFAGSAHADCSGGKSIKGNFGVTINGPVTGGSTAEVYNGILKADGKCGLKGTLTGGIFGQPSVTQSVTGSYSVPDSGQATVTLQMPDSSAAVVFDVGLVSDGKFSEVTGIATNGPAIATIEFVEMAKHNYGLSDLSGTYIATCTGAGNDGSGGLGSELAFVTFDGAGNVAVSVQAYDNGQLHSANISGTYSVSKSGAYTVQYPDPYSAYMAYGEIVADGTETRAVDVQSTSGYGPYRSCVSKKQS